MPVVQVSRIPDEERFELQHKEKLLIDMTVKVSLYITQLNSNLLAYSVSPNGQFVAMSDNTQSKLYRITETARGLAVKKCKILPEIIGAQCLTFSPDSSLLIFANLDSIIRVFDIESMQIVAEFDQHADTAMQIDEDQGNNSELIVSLAVSSDGKYLVSGDLSNQINVFDLESFEVCDTD